jgi:holo-[acyl-carrier protein] synthase
MILGVGTDLCNIERIEATLARFGDRFRNRVFTEREQHKAEGRPHATAATYAKRWAAKEACSKALGTGLKAAERLAAMTPPGHTAVIHVTLTDDHPWAQAFVVIEARPAQA